jgi:hypothetical protein
VNAINKHDHLPTRSVARHRHQRLGIPPKSD